MKNMKVAKILLLLFLTSLSAFSQGKGATNITKLKDLSETTGIEMVVIDEAQKIARTEATHFKRWLRRSSYVGDPIESDIQQPHPGTKTVLLPGISFLIDYDLAEQVVNALNKRFAYRSCIAFISDDETRDDKKHTVSLIYATDKYNALRLQETSGGSYHFTTDSLIAKLQKFEKKYPFEFIAVGDEWLILKSLQQPRNWTDFAKEVVKVCPIEQTEIDGFTKALQEEKGKVFMWWD
jgi:hypothetical protein